jgi:hypothetical protein
MAAAAVADLEWESGEEAVSGLPQWRVVVVLGGLRPHVPVDGQ